MIDRGSRHLRRLLAVTLLFPHLAFAGGGWRENPSLRTLNSVTFENGAKRVYQSVLGTPLIQPNRDFVDMTPVRRNDAVIDGWEITKGGWHYRIGRPSGKATDGWIGFGGLQGRRWIYYRLVRVGYLHYPTRAWQDVGGAPSYARAQLSSTPDAITLGPDGAAAVSVKAAAAVEWRNLWTTPGSGEVYAKWHVDGKRLKEDVVVNAAARTWIGANAPPLTAVASTYFGMVFQLDASDIPKVLKNGSLQDVANGDFDDDNGASDIDLKDADDAFLAFMPISRAFSQDGQTSIPLRKRIWKDGDGNVYLIAGAKVSDLNSLPAGDVVFDPTVAIQPDGTAGIDNRLQSALPTTNNGTVDDITIGGAPSSVSIIKFDVTSIPANASSVSATITFTSRNVSASQSCSLYPIKAANAGWTELGSTWNTIDGVTAWAGVGGCGSAGVDYDASPAASWTSSAAGAGGVADTTAFSASVVSGWAAAPGTNYGLVLRGSTASSTLYSSSDSTTASWRPMLSVTYTVSSAGMSRRPGQSRRIRELPAVGRLPGNAQ